MHLGLDEEQVAVAQLARRLADDVLAPAARAADGDGVVPVSVWAALYESGLIMTVPQSLGGGGVLHPLSQQQVIEALAHGDPGIAMAAAWSGAASRLLAEYGSPTQQELLAELARDASRRSAIALYEGFGRSAREYTTTIAIEGDTVRVEGMKVGVAFAAVADPLIVVGRDPLSGELRAVVTSGTAEGVVVAPVVPALALDVAQLTDVSFDLALPTTALVGGGAGADPLALEADVQRLRLLVASGLLGTAQRAVEYAAQYATERVAFGRPIAGFQGVSFPLAESLMAIEAARLQVADLVTRENRFAAEEFDRAVSEAVAYASTIAVDATRHGVQTLGGHGFIRDHPVELWYRSATVLAALDLDPACAPFEPAV